MTILCTAVSLASLSGTKRKMEWTALVGPYRFVSDPLPTSSSTFAEIGHERNGSFLP
jgi:hypothetical protein